MCNFKHACASVWWGLWFLLLVSPCEAAVLVEYTFGDSVATATNLPLSVAPNLWAAPVIGKQGSTGQIVPQSFIQWSPGNMGMRLSSLDGPSTGGRRFEFALQADPGFTFQLTDFVLTWRASNTYGCAHDVVLGPNLDPGVNVHNGSGGDFMATLGPAYPYWQMAPWNLLSQRTDLTSLVAYVSLVTSGGPYTTDLEGVRISGNVLPVPEPATLGLLPPCAWLLARRHGGPSEARGLDQQGPLVQSQN